jgi:hypothetical protein
VETFFNRLVAWAMDQPRAFHFLHSATSRSNPLSTFPRGTLWKMRFIFHQCV